MQLEMQKNEFEGKLITFCGLDGCGKTTQIKRLVDWLESKGHKVYLTKQPTDFVRNSEIFRTYMDSPTHDAFDYRALSLLCASDRVQHTNRVISQKLKEGYIVISDRYFYSCLANLIARGFEGDTWIYDVAKSILKPNVAFFLNVPVDEAIRRVRDRPEEKNRYIDVQLQKKLHDLYVTIARDNNGVVISTLLSEDVCFKRVEFEVEKILIK
ncbi:MAG: dTMP kinase [Clostridiales bacterium]|nr:MAG: dTMP kinase [Clostridiales bacterium]